MRFRITPLNILTSILFAFLAVGILQTKTAGQHFDLSAFRKLFLGCLIIVTFFADLIFRSTLKNLKRIWIIESIFIVITLILMIIIQKVT